ncbi:MAG: hypothetical protein M3Q29_06540 [Chloroflexota bacterium]|nr:hypothetical protein [Chloroflexota bacterium]
MASKGKIALVDSTSYGFRVYAAVVTMECRRCHTAVAPGGRVRRAGVGTVECEACWGLSGATCTLPTCTNELPEEPYRLDGMGFCSRECVGRWLLNQDPVK